MGRRSAFAEVNGTLIEIVEPPVYRDAPNLDKGKNIVVCADGTGNADIKGRGSNVFKLFEAVDTTTHLYTSGVARQIAFYHEGVGTESVLVERVLDGATGLGVARDVRDLYAEIARVYQPGDRIHLFGFSRGAFTVRTLAGLIDSCGILDASSCPTNDDLEAGVGACYAHFMRGHALAGTFHPRCEFPIEFVGVWDTVDAVGLPLPIADQIARRLRIKRDVQDLPASVRYGCHALALDEPRESFAPVLWRDSDRAEQVWFAGAHSDIGGGYPRQGLSIVALHWMMERARVRGLRFSPSDSSYYAEHQIAADKVHDPRTGLALYYRWQPRNVLALCRASEVTPQLHISVLDRVAQGVDGYAPINIPVVPASDPRRLMFTFTGHRDWELLDPNRISRALDEHEPLIRMVEAKSRTTLSTGIASYWILVAATLAVVAGLFGSASAVISERAWQALWSWSWSVSGLLAGIVGLLAAWLLARWTDGQLDDRYSELWQKIRPQLRQSLGRMGAPPAYLTEQQARQRLTQRKARESGDQAVRTALISCPLPATPVGQVGVRPGSDHGLTPV